MFEFTEQVDYFFEKQFNKRKTFNAEFVYILTDEGYQKAILKNDYDEIDLLRFLKDKKNAINWESFQNNLEDILVNYAKVKNIKVFSTRERPTKETPKKKAEPAKTIDVIEKS